MKTEQQLTLQQAIEQGYTHYVDEDDCARPFEDIEDGDDEDFPDGATILSPEAIQTVFVTPKEIKDLIEDYLYRKVGESADEQTADQVEKHCGDLKCEYFANYINNHFKDIYHYETTNFTLTK